MKYSLCEIILVLVLLVGCAATTKETQVQAPVVEIPAATTPSAQETPVEEVQPEAPKEIPTDIKSVLEKGKTKLTSYSYEYKSPSNTEAYKIYVNGNKIKIVPPDITNVESGKFYNTVYLDTEKKTAEAYCVGYTYCTKNLGKIKDLVYSESYIETPVDWLKKVTEAEKIDERQVEGRKSLYLQTNIGKITVESYYGFLYRVEDGKKVWEFSSASFNSVSDEDVVPQ